MDDYDNTPIVQAHRIGRLACEAQSRGHWQQAIDKHTRAAQQFLALQTHTTDTQALLALRLLSQHHLDQAHIIERTLYHETPTPRTLAATTTTTTSNTLTQINNHNNNNSLVTQTSDLSLSPVSHLLSLLRNKPFEMESQNFTIVMNALEELRMIVAKPNIPSQAVRKSPADIETDLQSHLAFGRDVSSRLNSTTGRPDELATLRDLTPSLIRQHASLAQNEAALLRENDMLRQTIQSMQEMYAQKSQIVTNALTSAYRPLRPPAITQTDNTTPPPSDAALLDANKLLSEKLKLEKQVHVLSKQLKAEMAQVKKQAAVIDEQKQRWNNLKEAARTKRERDRNRNNAQGTSTPTGTITTSTTSTTPTTIPTTQPTPAAAGTNNNMYTNTPRPTLAISSNPSRLLS